MKVVFMGTPEFSVATLDAIVAAGHEVLAVYSQPPRPAGRGKKERPSPVHSRALELGIDVRTPLNFKDSSEVEAFAALDADVAVVVAYGLILPQSVLDAPKFGCINVHASLLPRWRGAAPIHRAIEAGDAQTGVGIMQMEAGLDTGPVIKSAELAIGRTETTGELHDRLAALGAETLVEVLSLAVQRPGNQTGQPSVPWPSTVQSEEGVTYAKKIDKAECQVDWREPAETVARKINAFSPFPGAFFELERDGKAERIKLLKAEVVDAAADPGTVLDNAFTVACGSGAVRILRAQRAGKGPMNAEDFLRGTPLIGGDVLPIGKFKP